MNKTAHSGFETQRRRDQKSKTGVSVAPQQGLMSSKIWKKILEICLLDYNMPEAILVTVKKVHSRKNKVNLSIFLTGWFDWTSIISCLIQWHRNLSAHVCLTLISPSSLLTTVPAAYTVLSVRFNIPLTLPVLTKLRSISCPRTVAGPSRVPHSLPISPFVSGIHTSDKVLCGKGRIWLSLPPLNVPAIQPEFMKRWSTNHTSQLPSYPKTTPKVIVSKC